MIRAKQLVISGFHLCTVSPSSLMACFLGHVGSLWPGVLLARGSACFSFSHPSCQAAHQEPLCSKTFAGSQVPEGENRNHQPAGSAVDFL